MLSQRVVKDRASELMQAYLFSCSLLGLLLVPTQGQSACYLVPPQVNSTTLASPPARVPSFTNVNMMGARDRALVSGAAFAYEATPGAQGTNSFTGLIQFQQIDREARIREVPGVTKPRCASEVAPPYDVYVSTGPVQDPNTNYSALRSQFKGLFSGSASQRLAETQNPLPVSAADKDFLLSSSTDANGNRDGLVFSGGTWKPLCVCQADYGASADVARTPAQESQKQGLPAESKQFYVTLFGHEALFQNATFFESVTNGATVGAFQPGQCDLPQPVPPGALPPNGCAALPADLVQRYGAANLGRRWLKLTMAPGSNISSTYTFTSSQPGVLRYAVHTSVLNGVASTVPKIHGRDQDLQVPGPSEQTRLWPRLELFAGNGNAFTAGACSAPFRLRTVDGNGGAVNTALNLIGNGGAARPNLDELSISIAPPAGVVLSGYITPDGKCNVPTTFGIANPPVVANSQRSSQTLKLQSASTQTLDFHLSGARAGEQFPLNISYADAANPGAGELSKALINGTSPNFTIHPAPVKGLVISGAPVSFKAGDCSSAFQIELRDWLGNQAVALAGGVALAVSAGAGSVVYLDSACTQVAPSPVSIAQGSGSLQLFVKSERPQELAFTVLPTNGVLSKAERTVPVLSSGARTLFTDPVLSRNFAKRLHERLSGTPPSEAVLNRMASLVLSGKITDAAHIAATHDGFINNVIRHFATPISNRFGDYLDAESRPLMNDFIATFMGAVRDKRTELLFTGDRVYAHRAWGSFPANSCIPSGFDGSMPTSIYLNDRDYQTRDQLKATNWARDLVPYQQCAFNTESFFNNEGQGIRTRPSALDDAAGLITTRKFMNEHAVAGTNRRVAEYALLHFMGRKIGEVANTHADRSRIRRDVDRAPGGKATIFDQTCSGCHAVLDPLSGAFAHFESYRQTDESDFRVFYKVTGGSGDSRYSTSIASKMNQNDAGAGHVTADDTWINQLPATLGTTITEGNGAKSLGRMILESRAFERTMARRAFKEVCAYEPSSKDEAFIEDMAVHFRNTGKNFYELFEHTASFAGCIGDGS